MGQQVQKEWLTAAEATEYCGLSRSSLWRFSKAGKLNAFRHGRSIRFRRADLDRLFEEYATQLKFPGIDDAD